MACLKLEPMIHHLRGRSAVLARLLALTLLFASQVACADTWVLLVGVGEVASLPPRLWLRGPAQERDDEVCERLLVPGFDLDRHELRLMRAALDRARGNVAEAARMLGITRRQLAYRLKDLGDA